MINFPQNAQARELAAKLDALNKSQAVIEFTLDGTIITANENFLGAIGYALSEIQGQHHSLFVTAADKASAEYQQFWENLRRGSYQAGEFHRIAKGGKDIYIQASYNPLFGKDGRPYKVVKYASDITAQKLQNADYAGQIAAISKSQAVIEFNSEGTIQYANENFLAGLGYTLEEIKCKHHSMFVDPAYRTTNEYLQFWASLHRGDYQAGEFRRIAKGGREVWIQASYNPILDLNGKVSKVVKYATDITQMVQTRTENESGMKEAVESLTAISHGDLTQRMEGNYQGTFADIKEAVNATVDKLVGTVTQIRDSAQSVNTAASEIASGSADLSMRTEQQASNLEETAASMEQITGTVKQNSANAATANELSTSASNIADAGGKVVGEAVEAMRSIEKSSQKISDIIGVIDEIAFQTNLLALNAAVEAARAGDAGKGFAVVASEVRALAGRSASASKEIKTLINESASQVKTGAELVNQAGDTLKGIVGSVRQVAGIVSEIASASVEQAVGIDEINSAVTQMDEATQQNAALVEQNTAAAQSMLEQAKTLDDLLGFFKVEEEAYSAPITFARKPAALTHAPAKPVKAAVRPAAPVRKASSAALAAKVQQDGWGWEEF